MKKYYIYIIVSFAFILFCSVGYGILSQELTISGRTSVNTNTKINCDITKISNNNLNVSVTNNFFSTTSGEIQITITNNNGINYDYFTILVNLPENITISNAYNGTYTITDNIMQIHGPDYAHNLNTNSRFSYHIHWNTNSSFSGLITEDVVAFGNDTLSNYTCTNGKWYLNGNIITTETKQDLHLSNLSVNSYSLLPTFNSKIYSYSLTVPNDISSVNITAIPNDTSTTITGAGEKILQEGNNKNDIIITGKNNNTLIYTINIYRALSGVTSNQNFGSETIYASYTIDYHSENTYQFTLTITNNSTNDISDWELSFDVGNGIIDAIWNPIYSSYDSSLGLITISSKTATDQALRIIKANTSIQIKGQIKAEYEPRIVKLSY